jgi:hypothetical protein
VVVVGGLRLVDAGVGFDGNDDEGWVSVNELVGFTDVEFVEDDILKGSGGLRDVIGLLGIGDVEAVSLVIIFGHLYERALLEMAWLSNLPTTNENSIRR